DPLRVESLDNDWYLRAWDHTREAVRTFRLDRVIEPVSTDEPVSDRSRDITLGDTLFEGSRDDVTVTLEVARAALPLLADFAPTGAGDSDDPERVLATITVPHFHRLKRLAAGMPGMVTVLDPPEAREAVAGWASAALAGYTGDTGP